jgi:hypothetical protein
MKHKPKPATVLLRGVLCTAALLAAHPAAAQSINFGAYTTARDIFLSVSGDLDFNAKQPVIVSNSGSTVTISLSDNETQYVAITADATRDITVTVTAPTILATGGGGAGKEIDFSCQFAYSNLNSGSAAAAKTVAVEVPAGFTAITLPVVRRTSGAPLPPPTPAHGGYTPPAATAYLFIYGSLGPVGPVNAGDYTGTVNVSVQY